MHPLHAKYLERQAAEDKQPDELPVHVDLEAADRDSIKKKLDKKQLLAQGMEEEGVPVDEKLAADIKKLKEELEDSPPPRPRCGEPPQGLYAGTKSNRQNDFKCRKVAKET